MVDNAVDANAVAVIAIVIVTDTVANNTTLEPNVRSLVWNNVHFHACLVPRVGHALEILNGKVRHWRNTKLDYRASSLFEWALVHAALPESSHNGKRRSACKVFNHV